MKLYNLVIIFILGGLVMFAQEDRRLIFEMEVEIPVEKAYEAWTTEQGINSFFAPGCEVELKLYGNYHIYFFPDAPKGSRGAEDEIIISHQKNKMFSFTWGAPPSLPDIRENQKTVVLLRFEEIDQNRSRLTFIQSGWGYGEDWDKCYQYFVSAWGKVVLARFKYFVENGPVDWNDLPDFSTYALSPSE